MVRIRVIKTLSTLKIHTSAEEKNPKKWMLICQVITV